MNQEIKVLDHGYVKYIEHWGSDERIIEAARMSTGKGFLGWGPTAEHTADCDKFYEQRKDIQSEDRSDARKCACGGKPGDEKLLRFLYTHLHSTPFEMAGAVIEVQAPIMVFREWHRHRTQSYSELSARYTPLPDVNYIPTPERCLAVSAANRQAGRIEGSNELTPQQAIRWLEDLSEIYAHAQRVYEHGLAIGIPKEVARLPVPVGRYSRMRASANLRNWLGFLSLRMPSNAQWEIRQFSNAVAEIISARFPRTFELFKENLKI